MSEVRRQVDGITSEITADPEAAERELTAAREALGAAERRLTGETQEHPYDTDAQRAVTRAFDLAIADGADMVDMHHLVTAFGAELT